MSRKNRVPLDPVTPLQFPVWLNSCISVLQLMSQPDELKSMMYIGILSLCCTVGSDKRLRASMRCPTGWFHCPTNPLHPTLPLPLSPQPQQPLIFQLSPSFAFQMSQSWTHIVCGLPHWLLSLSHVHLKLLHVFSLIAPLLLSNNTPLQRYSQQRFYLK